MLQGKPVRDLDAIAETQDLHTSILQRRLVRNRAMFSDAEHTLLDAVKIDLLPPDLLSALFHSYRLGSSANSTTKSSDNVSAKCFANTNSQASQETFTREINFISAVGLKKVGTQMEFVPLTEQITERQVSYVVSSISEGRYCPWDGMRKKDIEFFREFRVIPKGECAEFGF